MKRKMKIILLLMSPLVLYGLYVLFVLAYGTLTDYKPLEKESVDLINPIESKPDTNEFSFLIWNIGYAGLGAETDFFFDGGTMVRPPRYLVENYLEGIQGWLLEHQETDFVLLQEVDVQSKRSYKTNELEAIHSTLSQHAAAFAVNYNVKYVPAPLTSISPLGKVYGGIASFSRYHSTENTRYQFPGNYSWPNRVFFLDRCFLLQRVPLNNGKELVVINSHNSAYDDGTLKQQQMAFLKNILLDEYEKGNYVVVGADWNQCPPNFDYAMFSPENADDYFQANISEDYLPEGWQWVYDGTVPTNRKPAAPYEKGKTFVTLIDFFLISPNIELIEVTGTNLEFKYSDHQPVEMKIRLKDA